MLSSGFRNAPVSNYLLFGLVATSVAVSITDSKYLFPIQVVPHLWPYKQAWRVLTWQLCYTNSTALLFASMTIYHMRLIERLWGSAKFTSFLVALFAFTAIFGPLMALLLRPLSIGLIGYLPAGPTPLVFALLAQYHSAIPHVYKYRVATLGSGSQPSVMFSDKTITYLLAFQLALSQVPGSLLSAGVGWALGMAWRNDILPGGVMTWRLPGWFGGKKESEGFDGLRRRLEGESRATGVERNTGAQRR